MQRKKPNLLTKRTIGEYLGMTRVEWPHTTQELERLQRASKVLVSLGFSKEYRMSYNVVHWAHVVASLHDGFSISSQHANFIWLCNKIATFFRKRDFEECFNLVLVRGDDITGKVSAVYSYERVTWFNEKTNAEFTLGYQPRHDLQ